VFVMYYFCDQYVKAFINMFRVVILRGMASRITLGHRNTDVCSLREYLRRIVG